jgi:sugar lactone lactonase YvrE
VEEAFSWLERLPALRSTLVPQPADFPALAGERFTRLAVRLQRNAPAPQAPTALTLPQRDLLPEGIAYDPRTDTFFLSSMHLRKVVAVGPDGAARDFATAGLFSTLGMRVDVERRLLWVASTYTDSMRGARPEEQGRSVLHAFELDTGRERARFPRGSPEKKSLLNDLALGADGTVYVTDSEAGEVLSLRPGAQDFEVLVPGGTRFYPNGLTLSDDGRTLYFADYVHGVSVLRLDTGALGTLGHVPGVSTHGFDGLYFHSGALIGVENGTGPGRVVRLALAPQGDRVLGAQVLEAAHPLARIPTTGVLARGAFYLLVDSQLRSAPGGQPLPWAQLSDVHVVRVPLSR